jgi:hypothetical protein
LWLSYLSQEASKERIFPILDWIALLSSILYVPHLKFCSKYFSGTFSSFILILYKIVKPNIIKSDKLYIWNVIQILCNSKLLSKSWENHPK